MEMAEGVCQAVHVGIEKLTCVEREPGGVQCERIDWHLSGHKIGEHTIEHVLSGNGYACSAMHHKL